MSKPDWRDAPSWAEWLAQDASGTWHFYETEPRPYEGKGWINDGPRGKQRPSKSKPNPNWRTTLERRPDSEIAGMDELGRIHLRPNPAPDPSATQDPDLIIPKDAASEMNAYVDVEDLANLGYRIEVDSNGIRGWKE